ncbi:hypothetical protein [Nocardia miyunensis]|nr:hypothetical protein [Nocardia miyunensis]
MKLSKSDVASEDAAVVQIVEVANTKMAEAVTRRPSTRVMRCDCIGIGPV